LNKDKYFIIKGCCKLQFSNLQQPFLGREIGNEITEDDINNQQTRANQIKPAVSGQNFYMAAKTVGGYF
jgi:hypothetical protein